MGFDKILIANRGEIAVRVIQTAKAMGYRTVAVYSEADQHARHVQLADEAVCIGAAKVSESYLSISKIIEACQLTGANAVHPGYGFLSENAEFAQACAAAQICFIGPPTAAIALMGSKRLSKIAMLAAGVPCIPGYEGEQQDLVHLASEAERIGFPLMVKASAGGGGRGMRLVHDRASLDEALKTARSEAQNAFGSGELIIEKALLSARHVEMQIFADSLGNAVYLFERDCSIQRRHQKVLEEAPCPALSPALRERMGQAAVAAARACDYVGAGTVEFLLAPNGEFYFLEMNTRLQVEHPVTEMITGLDLVEWQLRVANQEPLPCSQADLQIDGHAIEVRLYAEDPRQGFLPQTGAILKWQAATQAQVRVDHGLLAQDQVQAFYDPMLAKIIAHGRNRQDALRRLRRAIADSLLLGVASNKQFLLNLLAHPIVQAGAADTGFISEHFQHDASMQPEQVGLDDLAIAALLLSQSDQPQYQGGLVLKRPLRVAAAGQVFDLLLQQQQQTLWVEHAEHKQSIQSIAMGEDHLIYLQNGVRRQLHYALHDGQLYFDAGQGQIVVENLNHAIVNSTELAGDGRIRAPMDGAVIEVLVNVGEQVVKGQTLCILEAMKIQQQVKADIDGVVGAVMTRAGTQVKKRQILCELEG